PRPAGDDPAPAGDRPQAADVQVPGPPLPPDRRARRGRQEGAGVSAVGQAFQPDSRPRAGAGGDDVRLESLTYAMKIDLHTHVLPPSLPQMRRLTGYGG